MLAGEGEEFGLQLLFLTSWAQNGISLERILSVSLKAIFLDSREGTLLAVITQTFITITHEDAVSFSTAVDTFTYLIKPLSVSHHPCSVLASVSPISLNFSPKTEG